MKNFLAIYMGSGNSSARAEWDRLSAAERQKRETAGIGAWHDWMATHQRNVVVPGGPLGKTKRAAPGGVTDTRNAMAGYTLVQAESHEAAARMFEKHPHFTLFPGESVEIMEVLPIPGQPQG